MCKWREHGRVLGHVTGKCFSVKGNKSKAQRLVQQVIKGSPNEISPIFKIRLCFPNDELHCVDFIQLELGLFNTITPDNMAWL